MEFIIIIIILVFIFEYRNLINSNKFVQDMRPYSRMLMEDDYKFLVNIRYGNNANADILFDKRIKLMIFVIILMLFIFIANFTFINIILALVIGYAAFKLDYVKLKNYYKRHLFDINRTLPYYLKSLEILIQHYTVPVALRRSIGTAPEIFKPGLEKMVARIEAGDSTVDPYMDFAKEYPVRDSMRMMRLLYRLGLGEQEKKHQQLVSFSRSVSSLQAKAREMKYKARLDTMEKKTLVMMVVTGAGSLILLLISIFMLITSV